MFKSKAFQELSDTALAEVLKVDGLGMDEAEIVKYVKEWAAVNSVSSHLEQALSENLLVDCPKVCSQGF